MCEDGDVLCPYEEMESKLERQPNGKYRHISSYSLDELIDLVWDGARCVSTKGKHAAHGFFVPFVPGYDSDSEDEYEKIDIHAGKRAGTVGLPEDEVGLYMEFPDIENLGNKHMVSLNDGH